MMKNLRNHFYFYCCLLIVMVMTTKAATPASLLYHCNNTMYNPDQDPGYRKDLLDFLVAAPVDASRGNFFSNHTYGAAVAIALSIASSIALFIVAFVFLKRRARKRKDVKLPDDTDGDEMLTIDPESLQYSLSVIQIATNNFSMANKIGQGGFGGVYKGTLPNGQDIAVKRLSKSSGQGAEEFKNEIGVVAKLQHRNLVRLLGFCLEGVEKILVYEFVQNKSLDNFLFGWLQA